MGCELIPGMSRQQYDNTAAINWSRLRLLEKSPALFKHGRGEDSSGFELGTATHVAVLEPEKFEQDFITYPGKVRRGGEWEAFEKDAIRSGKTVISRGDYELATNIRTAVRAHAKASQYLSGGVAEFSMVWTLESAPGSPIPFSFLCKGRGDYLGSALVDLKSTKDASPRAFAASCMRFGYYGQAAWYSDGYARISGQRKPFVIVAVESSAPHIVQVYRLSDRALEYGRDQYMSLLGKLDYCTKRNFWGGYSEAEELDLDVPTWATEAAP